MKKSQFIFFLFLVKKFMQIKMVIIVIISTFLIRYKSWYIFIHAIVYYVLTDCEFVGFMVSSLPYRYMLMNLICIYNWLIICVGVTSFSIDMEAKKVTIIGHVTPLGVLASVSKVKNAQLWPSSTSSLPSLSSSMPR